MVRSCYVLNCTTDLDTEDVKLFRVPQIFNRNSKTLQLSTERREAWLKALNRPDLTEQQLKVARVCAKHFVSGKCANMNDIHDPDWVPSLNLGIDDITNDNGAVIENENTTVDEDYKNMISEPIVEEIVPLPETDAKDDVEEDSFSEVIVTTTTKIETEPIVSTPPLSQPLPQKMVTVTPKTVTILPKPLKSTPQLVGQLKQLQPMQQYKNLKRKMDSPIVVKIEGLKRIKTVPTISNFYPQLIKAEQTQQAVTPTTRILKIVRSSRDCCTQTDISGDIIQQFQNVVAEDQEKISNLEEKLKKLKYTPEMFENDDKRTEYFTGLDSFVTMITLFNTCESELPQSSVLSKFEIFILTLLKLRLKLPLTYLGYQFGISSKSATYYFNECLNVLHKSLKELFTDPPIEMLSESN